MFILIFELYIVNLSERLMFFPYTVVLFCCSRRPAAKMASKLAKLSGVAAKLARQNVLVRHDWYFLFIEHFHFVVHPFLGHHVCPR